MALLDISGWNSIGHPSFTSLFNGNQAVDLLAARPNLVVLWAGYGFSKSYLTPRGHMYAIDDLYTSLRTGSPKGADDGPQPASCWSCKSSDAERLIAGIGKEAFFIKGNGLPFARKADFIWSDSSAFFRASISSCSVSFIGWILRQSPFTST